MHEHGGLYWASIAGAAHQGWCFEPVNLLELRHVQVHVVIVETSAEVRIVQKYLNHQAFPIEAMYVFPIDEHAAVCEFEAETRGTRFTGTVKSKTQARAEYREAVGRGDGAYLLEQEKADIFRAKVGNLLPGEEATITIKYVTELGNEQGKVRFVLPTRVAPRYGPALSVAPLHSSGDVWASLGISIACISMNGFASIESPSHRITTSIEGGRAAVGLAQVVTSLDKDFVLLLEYLQPHEPKVVIEESGKGDYAAMISLFPHLEFAACKTELIFLVDRSGSMESQVGELREALDLFMRSLPEDCFFNIIGFGSSFSKLMDESLRYSDETLEIATKHIAHLRADMGGTEIFAPLEYIYRLPGIPGYARQVFLLTDGQVSNTDQVISLVRKNNTTARTFALGIGDSVSHHLVEGVARAGKGSSAFALVGERIERKVLKQLKDATQPALNDVKVDWGITATPPAPEQPFGAKVLSLVHHVSPGAQKQVRTEVQQAPHQVPPLHSDAHFRIYALISGSAQLPEKVKISAASPDGILELELPIRPEATIQGDLLHTLAARTLIRDLEEGSSYLHVPDTRAPPGHTVQEEITALGIKYHLASKFTSFLAIEERSGTCHECYAPAELHLALNFRNRRSSGGGMSGTRGGRGGSGRGGGGGGRGGRGGGGHFDLQDASRMREESSLQLRKQSRDDSVKKKRSKPRDPSPTSPTNPTGPRSEFWELLKLQSFRGTFPLSEALAHALKTSPERLQQGLEGVVHKEESVDRATLALVWGTVLALLALKRRFSDLEAEWELAGKKSRTWLASLKLCNLPAFEAAAQQFV